MKCPNCKEPMSYWEWLTDFKRVLRCQECGAMLRWNKVSKFFMGLFVVLAGGLVFAFGEMGVSVGFRALLSVIVSSLVMIMLTGIFWWLLPFYSIDQLGISEEEASLQDEKFNEAISKIRVSMYATIVAIAIGLLTYLILFR